MLIQPISAPSTTNTAARVFTAQPKTALQAASTADSVTISKAARDALAAALANTTKSDSTSQSQPLSPSSGATTPADPRLTEIRVKNAMTRTADDMDYLYAHDPQLSATRDKINANNGSTSTLTAEELDYEQKAIGFVNSMASLSPAEKATYDKMVASGNTAAAAGMSVIAFERATLGHTASTKVGVTYDPTSTAITPENIVKYFSQSFSDPTGKVQSQFQALIQYLQNNPATA